MEERAKQNQLTQSMKSVADRFLDRRHDFFLGRMTEKELTDITTQPFWESVRLSKARLDEKGLLMDVSVTKEKNGSPARIRPADGVRPAAAATSSDSGIPAPRQSGYYTVGHSVRNVWTQRSFYKNGKRIYHKREQEISNVGLMRSQLNGEYALCPNCGHEDKISRYIDGCDYCGSKFLVSDFEPKVSAYSLEENIPKKLNKTMTSAFLFLILLSVLGVVGILAGLAILIWLLAHGDNGLRAINSVIVMVFSMELIPLAFRTIIPFTILFLIGRSVAAACFGTKIVRASLPRETIPNFSAEDFWQNLDYQLKSIHLIGDGQTASPFASCSLDHLAGKYRDVVDRTLTKLTFLDASETDGGYAMKVRALLKLTICSGNRIRIRYEQLSLSLFTGREAANRNILALREYKCPNCNGSVNILLGGVCDYCKTAVDYSEYGWCISSYTVERRSANIYRKAQAATVAAYALVLILNILINGSAVNGDNWLDISARTQEAVQELNAVYLDVLLPDTLPGVMRTASREFAPDRAYVYESEDGLSTLDAYRELLSSDGGYILASADENKLIFYLPVVVQGDAGYIKGIVTREDNVITVTLTPTEKMQ